MGLPIFEENEQNEQNANQMPATDMPHDQEKLLVEKNLINVKRKIGIHSGKGGVGKTFLSVNLAYLLNRNGKKAGLFDVDIDCPNVAKFLNLADVPLRGTPDGRIYPLNYKGVKVVSSHFLTDNPELPMIVRGPIKHKVMTELLTQVNWEKLDVLVYDLPPGTADVPMSSMLIGNLDGIIIVTTPQKEAIMDARKSAIMARDLDVPILGIVENMSGEIFGEGSGMKLAKELNVKFLGSIPLSRDIRESNEKGKPVLHKFEEISNNLSSVALGKDVTITKSPLHRWLKR